MLRFIQAKIKHWIWKLVEIHVWKLVKVIQGPYLRKRWTGFVICTYVSIVVQKQNCKESETFEIVKIGTLFLISTFIYGVEIIWK